jgi:ribosome biogenesis GTPase
LFSFENLTTLFSAESRSLQADGTLLAIFMLFLYDCLVFFFTFAPPQIIHNQCIGEDVKTIVLCMEGLVIKNTGSQYVVKTAEGEIFTCKIKGVLRLKDIRSTNPIAVGDRVFFEPGEDGQSPVITGIAERKNYMIRRASNLSKQSHIIACNLDLAMLVVTMNFPPVSTTFIDRFLATAEAYKVPAILVFNKIDLTAPLKDMSDGCRDAARHVSTCVSSSPPSEGLGEVLSLYSSIGYRCFQVSAKNRTGLDELKAFLAGKITLISGHSGAGKSTLLNAILPEANAKTGEISTYHNKGMHTTTFSEMYAFGDGYLIDTPGIKGLGTIDIKQQEAGHFFPEIFSFSKDCRFYNCTHTHEPGCAVLAAVENGDIAESRYRSYQSILEDYEAEKYR